MSGEASASHPATVPVIAAAIPPERKELDGPAPAPEPGFIRRRGQLRLLQGGAA